jgi:hypothetical protein
VPRWRFGDTIHLGPGKVLRVVAIRDNDADQPPRLVVEDPFKALWEAAGRKRCFGKRVTETC